MVQISQRLKDLNHYLHDVNFHKVHPWQFVGINILDRPEWKWLGMESIPVRKAYSQIYVAENLAIEILPQELLIGNPAMSSVEFGTSVVGYLTKDEQDFFNRSWLNEGSLYGHHPPRWENIIKKGTQAIKKDISIRLREEYKKDKTNESILENLRGMMISLDALTVYASRCADFALHEAEKCQDPSRRLELLKMAETCRKVPLFPADNLLEALQSYWLTYTLLCSDGEMLPLGRIDQIFGHFYEADLQKGYVSEEEANDLIGCFLLKCNELVTLEIKQMSISPNYRSFKGMVGGSIDSFRTFVMNYHYYDNEPENSIHNKFFGQEANNRMMTAVVGGVDKDGHDATNSLSYLIIQQMNDLKLLFPTLGARVSKQTPPEFLTLLGAVLQYGQGEPIIYNDEAIISKYDQLGIPRDEIRQYSSDGCWEVIIPGKTNFHYVRVYTLQCLEWAMNNGVTVKTGNQESLNTGDLNKLQSFDMFYAAFLKHMENQMFSYWCHYVDGTLCNTDMVAPDPLFSAISDDCIAKGADFYENGARYQFRCMMLTGFADTVDSLVAIKKIVYEDKKITLSEFNQILRNDFAGSEDLRMYILNKVPKYGNCDDYADQIAIRLIDDFSTMIRKLRRMYDGFYLTGGIATFHMYGLWGNMTAASANGRHAYDALAPNYSPVPGMDKGGPLLALASSLKPDLSELMIGTPVDVSINAYDFKGDAGVRRIVNMIKSYCDAGGQIMSITASSAEELRDAMRCPEKHAGLRVRMGGLSAYFIQLSPEQQKKIIERFCS